jgi:hypothetical protein
LFLRHVGQEWLIWRVRFRGGERGWKLNVTRPIYSHLVEVSQILQGTDLVQVDGSVRGARTRDKSTARGLREITPRGATTSVARGLPHLLFEDNSLVLTVKFVPFDLCILGKAAPLVSIQPGTTETMDIGFNDVVVVGVDAVGVGVKICIIIKVFLPGLYVSEVNRASGCTEGMDLISRVNEPS